jgi:cell wall-associated NlpC family hydrolase
MRWIAFITVIILIGSCTALKPVIAKQADAEPSQHTTQPAFIENITANTAPQNKNVQAEPAVKYSLHKNIISSPGNIIESIGPLQFKYAILMDVAVEELNNSNSKLLQYIEDWYGTPYHFGGSTKNGIDCSAFAGNLVEAVFGIGLPRMAKDQYKVCRRISKDDLEEGDLVFFHTTRKGISHVGVYLGNNKFVHASLNYGVTISDLGDGYYARTLIGTGRVKQNNTAVSVN